MIAKSFFFSFLNVHFVGVHAKEYFRTINIAITQNVNFCNKQPLLEIMLKAVSRYYYVVVWPLICLILGSIFGKRYLLAIDHIMLALFLSYVPNMK